MQKLSAVLGARGAATEAYSTYDEGDATKRDNKMRQFMLFSLNGQR